jgi:cytochrome c oxidase subunit 3
MKWMLWTILGGIAFLLCQAWEWHHLITGEHAVLVDGKLRSLDKQWAVIPGVN